MGLNNLYGGKDSSSSKMIDAPSLKSHRVFETVKCYLQMSLIYGAMTVDHPNRNFFSFFVPHTKIHAHQEEAVLVI